MNWKIEGTKKLDSLIGSAVCSAVRRLLRPRKQTGTTPDSILVIRPGGIGDAALLIPALRHLRKSFENIRIDVLAEKRNSGLLKECSYIDHVFEYDSRAPLELISTIRTPYDVVIDTEQWHKLSATVGYLNRAPIRIGFATNDRKKMFTHPIEYSQNDYEAFSFLNLVNVLTEQNYESNLDEPFIDIDSKSAAPISDRLNELRTSTSHVAGIFSGATVRERRWGKEKFAALADDLLSRDIGVVIVGGPGDTKDAEFIAKTCKSGNMINLAGQTSLTETTAALSMLDLFISGDTGLLHISYGVGTPTVSLYGAGIETKWAPRGKKNITINKKLHCSPCTKFGYTPSCPYDVECLKKIKVDEVVDAAMDLINSADDT